MTEMGDLKAYMNEQITKLQKEGYLLGKIDCLKSLGICLEKMEESFFTKNNILALIKELQK